MPNNQGLKDQEDIIEDILRSFCTKQQQKGLDHKTDVLVLLNSQGELLRKLKKIEDDCKTLK